MKKSTIWALVIIVVLAVALIIISARDKEPSGPGQYDEFAQCITANGATMYGAYWCPHCANQKAMFGNSWRFVSYVECDPRGDNANPALCNEKGVQGYPTWIFADGSVASGELTLRELGVRTNCTLPSPAVAQ